MAPDNTITITGVGDRLQDEIREGEFDRYVIFTYGFDPQYLDWFEPEDQLAICGPTKTIETVRESITPLNISTFNRETHAKIYLLYNDNRIVAYLGSFNFTEPGLFQNVEWGARYEGAVVNPPASPRKLVLGEANTQFTTSPVIEQILDIVGASMDGNSTEVADSWATNTNYGEGVVHTLRSNTLQQALETMATPFEGTLKLMYFSPFVTPQGIREFTKHLPNSIDRGDVDFTVYTKRLDQLHDDEKILTPDEIEHFNDQFRSFQLRARAPGDHGNQLPHERELPGGMIHLKTIALASVSDGEHTTLGTILTSANLSLRAWNKRSDGFEIGVALSDVQRTSHVHQFYTELLPRCYAVPTSQQLKASISPPEVQSLGVEEWLDDRIRNRLDVGADHITIHWDDVLPELENLQATVYMRDLQTGGRIEQQTTLSDSAEGYVGEFPSIADTEGRVIDFIRVVATSIHQSPELVFTGREVQELRDDQGLDDPSAPLPESWSEFDEIVWNDSERREIENAAFDDVDEIQSARLRNFHEVPKEYYAIQEPDHQPHIDSVIEDHNVTKTTFPQVGPVYAVEFEFHPTINIDHTDLVFRLSNQHQQLVEPIGFEKVSNSYRSYFGIEVTGAEIDVSLLGLISRFFGDIEAVVSFPESNGDSTSKPTHLLETGPWRVRPQGIDPILTTSRYDLPPEIPGRDTGTDLSSLISQEHATVIHPPEGLQTSKQASQLAIWWRPSTPFETARVQSVTEAIGPQPPRSRVTYLGLAQLGSGEQTMNVPLASGSYVVKEQPFIDQLPLSLENLPSRRDLSSLRNDFLLGWITIQIPELLKPRASDTIQHVGGKLYRDSESVPTRVLPVSNSNRVFCIPVLGGHIGRTVDLKIRLWVSSNGPPKNEQYAEAIRPFTFGVEQPDDGSVSVSIEDGSTSIDHSVIDGLPSLEPIVEINRSELEGMNAEMGSEEIFEIQSSRPLRINPKEMMLLQLTDG